MTSTAFQSSQTVGGEAFHNVHDVDRSTPVNAEGASTGVAPVPLSNGYAAERLRMKAFAVQCKFHAPVADDFTRGMLEPGQESQTDAKLVCAWAALIKGLTRWWCGQKPG